MKKLLPENQRNGQTNLKSVFVEKEKIMYLPTTMMTYYNNKEMFIRKKLIHELELGVEDQDFCTMGPEGVRKNCIMDCMQWISAILKPLRTLKRL